MSGVSEQHGTAPGAAGPADSGDARAATVEPEGETGRDELADEAVAVPPLTGEEAPQDAEAQRDEYLDALRRLQADFENYRKRVERDLASLAARGVVALVTNLLPVLDALDLAEDHLLAGDPGDGALGAETRALVQARALLLDTLSKEGLERLGTAGEGFDPTVHDAVMHAEGDDGPVVDEVLRAGYRWHGQVLRPAMVKVRG